MTAVAEAGPLSGSRASSFFRAAALGAGCVALAGVAVAVAAARASSSTAGSPISPPGSWHPAFVAAVAVSFAAYAAGLLLLSRRSARSGPVLALAVGIQLAPLFAPLLLSLDALTYDALGVLPHPFSARPAYGGGQTYGPLWQLVSEPLARLDGGLSDTGGYAFRVLAAVSVLALVGLVWRVATRKALAAAIVGWNPFVALHYPGGGHNDALMMVLVVGAIMLANRDAAQAGGVSWATALALKWTAAWFFVLWAIDRFRRRRPLGLAGFATTAVGLLALAFAVYRTAWIHALSNLSSEERIDHPSLGTFGWLEDAGLSRHPAIVAVTLLQVATLAAFALVAWRRRLRLGLAAGFLVLTAPRIDPWYALWPLSLAAADDDDRWGRVLAVCLSGFLLTDAVSTFIDA